MATVQAISTSKGREKSMPFLKQFVEEAKKSGLAANGLARSNQRDAASPSS